MWTEHCCDGGYVSEERKGGSELKDESKPHINTPSEGLLFLKILRRKNRLERGARQRAPGGLRAKRGRCDASYVTHAESCAVVQKLHLRNRR